MLTNLFSKKKWEDAALRGWRILRDATMGFINDDCYSKASALTFYTLLSVVPVIAVLLGIAKGFGFEKTLKMDIAEKFQDQREAVEIMMQFAYTWLQSVQSGVIAGAGAVLLFWSVIGLLGNIERSLNDIWKTKYARNYGRKIIDYFALIIISPFILVLLSGLNVYITLHVTGSQNAFIEYFGHFVLFILKFSPFFLSWLLFTFVYLFMPNTKVYWSTGLIAGILAGTAFQVWQWIYIKFQVGASSYGAIYGSFAALPLFLIWVQVSWLILLGGAELAYEMENKLFVPIHHLQNLSSKAAALYITHRCIEAFAKDKPPVTDKVFTHELGLSMIDVHNILDALQKEGILSFASYKEKMKGYQPAKAINLITMQTVCNAIEKSRDLKAYINDSMEMRKIQHYLASIESDLHDPKNDPLLYEG